MLLDLSSLKLAVESLENAIAISKPSALQQFDEKTKPVIKAGVIQNFEFTYEISHKMLKRYLEMTSPNPTEIAEMPFPDIIRTGSEAGLLKNSWDAWKKYRTARGTTSHAYDEKKADDVLNIVPDFLLEAKYLLAELEKRNE